MKRIIGIIGLAAITLLLMGSAFGIHGDWMQPALARSHWPEKEETARIRVESEGMRDSCVPLSPFDLPMRSPSAC